MSAKSNLIVNYVSNEITDAQFRDMFSPFGAMSNCKLVKDKITGQSVGYGFVKYETDDNAQAAIDALNGTQCGPKRMKVSIARPEGSASKERSELFIGGMPKNYTESDVQGLFVPYGIVEEVKIFTDNATGASRGSAFVRMDTAAHAQAAITGLNGQHQNNGQGLTVKEFTSKSRQNEFVQSPPDPSYGQQYGTPYGAGYYPYSQPQGYGQGGYPYPGPPEYDMTASQAYGQPAGMYGQQMQATAYPGYGRSPPPVYGAHPSMRAQNSGASRYSPMGGGKPPGSYHQGTGQIDPSSSTLFVFHLPTTINEDGLRGYFEPYGSISEVTVIRSKEDNSSKGYGFVSYATHEEAQKALDSMNGFQIGTKYLKVSYKK